MADIADELSGGEIEARGDTGVMQGLTEPDWAQSRLITGMHKAVSTRARETAAHQTAVNMRIIGAIISLATGTLAARALGVINQPIISSHFGAGAVMDAYFATLALPVLLTNLFVKALQSSVIPLYVRLTKEQQDEEASRVLSSVLNVALLLVAAITVLMLAFPGTAVRIMAPGASATTIAIGARLAPLIFPILLLNTIVGFLTCISNATRRFAFPAFSAMLVPTGIFLGTVLLGNILGISALALGLLGGTVLQFLLMMVLTRRLRLHYRPVILLRHRDVRTALGQMWPMLIGAAIGQANPVIDQVIASLLGTGSISALNYALKIIDIPVTVIFVAYSQAVYPYLSSQVATKNYTALKETLRFFAWMVGILTAIISIGMIVLAHPLISLIYRHGEFSAQDATMTANVLIGFSIGLVPMSLEFLLMRVFNSLQRADLLLKISLYTMVTNAALDVFLAHFFGLPGIALATSLDYLLTGILLLSSLRLALNSRLGLLRPPPNLLSTLLGYPAKAANRYAPLLPRPRFAPLGASLKQTMRNLILCIAALLIVAVLTIQSAVQGLRASISMALAVVFLASPYGMLLIWASGSAFYSVYFLDHSLGFVLALASLPAIFLIFWQERRAIRSWPIGLGFYALLLLWMLVGIKLSPIGVRQFAIDWLGFFDYLAVFVLAMSLLTTRQRFEWFVTAILIVSTALSIVGILEYALRFGGYQEPDAALIYRVGGIFNWSNSFSFYLVLMLPFCLYRLLTAARERRLFWAVVLALHGIALLFTFSRTGLITAPVVLLVAALLLGGRLRKWLLATLAGLIVVGTILMFVPKLGLRQRILGNQLATLNDRTAAWRVLLVHLNLRDPRGHGLFASLQLLGATTPDGVIAPHNVYLQVLYDHGTVGLALFVLALGAFIVGAAIRTMRSTGNARIALALATGGLTAAALYIAVSNTFWVYDLGTYFWLLAAIPYAPIFSRLRRKPQEKLPTGAEGSSPLEKVPTGSLARRGNQ